MCLYDETENTGGKTMLRKTGILLMVLLMLLPAVLAENKGEAYIIDFEEVNFGDRLKLRSKPSTGADVLGQYFKGVPVTVYDIQGEWARVSVAGREGYMMTKFLKKGEAEYPAFIGEPGVVVETEENGWCNLYTYPQKNAPVNRELPLQSGRIQVWGTVGDQWLHVAVYENREDWWQGESAPVYGFVSSDMVSKSDNMAHTVVATGEADTTVNLRSKPDQSAQSLGKLFSGVELTMLFDDHTNGDGWEKVRIGDQVGYIMDKFLDYSSAGVPAFRPPLSELKENNARLYDKNGNLIPDSILTKYDGFSVVGIFGKNVMIRIQTPFAEEPYAYAYIRRSDLKRNALICGSTKGKALRDQPLYWHDEHGNLLETQYILQKGQSLWISSGSDGKPLPTDARYYYDGYILPTDEWLWIEAEIESEGSWIGGLVPLDSVQYDGNLDYPECMTLG